MSRYETLTKTEPNQYIATCPVIIEKYAILKDTKKDSILLQVKYKRIANKKIEGLIVSVESYDIKGDRVEGVQEFQYLDIDNDNQTFGEQVPIKLPDKNTRRCKILIKEAIYDDGTVWKNNDFDIIDISSDGSTIYDVNVDDIWSEEEINELMSQILESKQNPDEIYNESVTQYRLINDLNEYLFVDNDNYWICSCGELNCIENDFCYNCGKNKETLKQQQDFSEIKSLVKEKLINEKIEYDKACEEQKIKEAKEKTERIERAKRTKRNIKIASIASIIIVCVAGIIFGGYHLYVDVIKPNRLYNSIEELIDNQKYDQAQIAINDFNVEYENKKDTDKLQKKIDSHEEEVIRKKIKDFLDADQFDKAYEVYKSAPYGNDYSRDLIYMLYDYSCTKAEKYYNNGEYKKAYDMLQKLFFSDYTDGRYEKLCSKTGTKLYNEALKNKKYSQAITYGKYLDDNKKVCEAKYKYVKYVNKPTKTVAKYLGNLVRANYKDSKKINNKLYKPYVSIKVNSSGYYNKGNETLYSSEHYDKYVCVKLKNYNGYVNRKGLKIYYVITSSGESSGKQYFISKRLFNNEITSSSSWMINVVGTWYVKVYDNETKKLLGEKTFYLH